MTRCGAASTTMTRTESMRSAPNFFLRGAADATA